MTTTLATLTTLCGLLLHFFTLPRPFFLGCAHTTIDFAEEHEILCEIRSSQSQPKRRLLLLTFILFYYFLCFFFFFLLLLVGLPQPQPPDYLTLNFKHTNTHTDAVRHTYSLILLLPLLTLLGCELLHTFVLRQQ